jgi:hypothetical protein
VPETKETAAAGIETPTTTSEFEIVPVTFEVLLGDGYHLFQQHCEELEGVQFEPDLARYEQLQKQRTLLCIGVYLDNYMLGYSTTILYRHGHQSNRTSVKARACPLFGRQKNMPKSAA